MEIYYFILGALLSFLVIQGKAAEFDSTTNIFSSDGSTAALLESIRGEISSVTSTSTFQSASTSAFNDLSQTTDVLPISNNIDSSSAIESSITPQLSEAQTRNDIPTSSETNDFSIYTNTPVLENIDSTSRTESSITLKSTNDYDIATSSQETQPSTAVKDSSSSPPVEGTASSKAVDATEAAKSSSDLPQQSVVISSATTSNFIDDIHVTSSRSVQADLSTSYQTSADSVSSHSENILQTVQLETSSAYTEETTILLETAAGGETQLFSSSPAASAPQDTSPSDIVDTQTQGLINPTKTSSLAEDATTSVGDDLSESQIVSSVSEGDVSSSSFFQDLASTDTFQRSSSAISQATYQTQSQSISFVSSSVHPSHVDMSSELLNGDVSSVVLSSVQSSTPVIPSSQDLGNIVVTSDQIVVSTATDSTLSLVVQSSTASSTGFESDVFSTLEATVISSLESDLISTPSLDVVPSSQSQSVSVLQSKESSIFIGQSSVMQSTEATSSAYYQTILFSESLDLYPSEFSSSISEATIESISQTTSISSIEVSEVPSYPSESQSQTSTSEPTSHDAETNLISEEPSWTLSASLLSTSASVVIPTDLPSRIDTISSVTSTEEQTVSSPGLSQTYLSLVFSDTTVDQSSETSGLSVSPESISREPSTSFQAHETDIIFTYTLSVTASVSESRRTSSSVLFPTETSIYEASLTDTLILESDVFATEPLSTFQTASSSTPSYLPPIVLESLTESLSSDEYLSSSVSAPEYLYSSGTERLDTSVTLFSSQLMQTSQQPSYISGITASSLIEPPQSEILTSIDYTASSEMTSAPIIIIPTIEQSSSQIILASFESAPTASTSSQTEFTSRDQSVSTQLILTYGSFGSYTQTPTMSSLGETLETAFSDITASVFSDMSSMTTEQASPEVTSVSLTSDSYGPVLNSVTRTVVQSEISATVGATLLYSTASESFGLPSSMVFGISTSPSSGSFSQSAVPTDASVSGVDSSSAGDIILPSLTTESSMSAFPSISPSESAFLLTSTGTLQTVSSSSEGSMFVPVTISLETPFTSSEVESVITSSSGTVIILPSDSFMQSSLSSSYPFPPLGSLESSLSASTGYFIGSSVVASQESGSRLSSSFYMSSGTDSFTDSFDVSSVSFSVMSSESPLVTSGFESLISSSSESFFIPSMSFTPSSFFSSFYPQPPFGSLESSLYTSTSLSILPSSPATQVSESSPSSAFYISLGLSDATSTATSEISSLIFPALSSVSSQTSMVLESSFTASRVESTVISSTELVIILPVTATATSEISSLIYPALSSVSSQISMVLESSFTASRVESTVISSTELVVILPSLSFTPSSSLSSYFPVPPSGILESTPYASTSLSTLSSSHESQASESSSFYMSIGSSDVTSTATSEISHVTFPPLSSESLQTTMSLESLYTTYEVGSVISSSSESIILPSLGFTQSTSLSSFSPHTPSRSLESSLYASTDLFSSLPSSEVESVGSTEISSMTFSASSTKSAIFVLPTTVLSSDISGSLSSGDIFESVSLSSDSVFILPTSRLSSDAYIPSSKGFSESVSIGTSVLTSDVFSDISSVISDLSSVPESMFSSYTPMLPSVTPYFTSTGVVSLESRSSTETLIQSELSTLVPSFMSTSEPIISTGYLSVISSESGRGSELTSFVSMETYTSLQPGSYSSRTVESSMPAIPSIPSVTLVTSSLESVSSSLIEVSSSVMPFPTEPPQPTLTSSVSMSSSVLPTTPPTTPPSTTPSLNTSEALKEFWVVTVIKVRRSEDVTSGAFKSNIQSKLASVYQAAFTRQEMIKNGTYEPLKRRKRYATSPDGSVKLQVVDVKRETGSNTKLTYLAEKDGKVVPADTMVDTLGLLDDQEVALGLGYVVTTKAEPYVPVPVTPTEDRKLWIIAAVLGPLALILLIWIIVCLSCRFCCNRKHMAGEEPHLMKVRRDGNQVESEFGGSDGPPDYPPEQGNQRSNGIGLIKSGTKKMSYDVNPEPDNEAALYAEVKKPVEASRLPKKKKHPSPSHQSTGGDSVVYVSEDDHQNTPVKRKGRKQKHPPAKADDSQSPVENMVEPYYHEPRSKPLPVPRAVKPAQSDVLPTAEEEEELVERAEMERLRNKQRLREQRKRDKQNNTGSTRSRDHGGKDGYRKAQKEIDAVLGSADHDENLPDVFVHKPKKRSSRRTKEPKEGHSNEAFTEDEQEASSQSGESLEEAKRRMHRLLDDAFSLISSSRSSIGNKVTPMDSPKKGLSRPEGHGQEEVTPRSNGHIPAESKESKPPAEEKKHTPMFFNPTFSGKDDTVSGLETWSPYRAADEVALISLPQTQTVLDKTPTQERLQTTTFNESYPTSMRDSYYTTEPAKPIVIRTKDLVSDGQDDTNSFKPFSSKHQTVNGIGTGGGTGGLPNGDATYPGMKGYEDIPLHSVSGKSRTHDPQRENGDVPHRAPVKTWAGQDEVDIVSSLEPGASPRPFIRSLREELEHLSTRVGDNPGTDSKGNALA